MSTTAINDDVATETTPEMPEVLLALVTSDGSNYTGRFHGIRLVTDGWEEVFKTETGSVVVYDAGEGTFTVFEDPQEDLRDVLSEDAYVDVMTALGIEPVVELDV